MLHAINPLQVFDRPTTLKLLNLSKDTFDRLESRGDGPPKIQLSANRIGYRADHLQQWLDGRLLAKTG